MYEILTLDNGVRIAFEHMDSVRSAAVGIWVAAGSRCEKRSEGGSAHFIEHMLFKGTERYSAADLAERMDAIGGMTDAYTTRETTCFYARVLDTHLDEAAGLLGDMFLNPRFDEADVQSERGVILEEIDMYEDSPEDVCAERLTALCFPGALGRPILGIKSGLTAMTGQSLREFKERHYVPENVVVTLCGSFSDAQLERIARIFGQLEPKKAPSWRKSAYKPAFCVKRRATEQNHICLGFPGLAADDGRRFALHTLTGILGGGMSSRLFQSVREKNGLCYSIYAYAAGFAETGMTGVATALGRDSEKRAVALILDELERIKQDGVTEPELRRATEQTKSGLLMSLESTSARMNRLGSALTTLGVCLTPDEVIERYDAVTCEDVMDLARELFDRERMSFSAVGRVCEPDEYRALLK